MSVVNGQIANQTTFNNAFMSRTAPTTSTVAKVRVENTLPASGAAVDNIQQAHNETFDAVGMTGIGDTNRNVYASNEVIADGQDRKEALEALDAEFNNSTGHAHTGAAGDGGIVSAANLNDFNKLFAMYQSVNLVGAEGLSDDVSALFSGETPGAGAGAEGVITDAPLNKVFIVDSDTNTFIEDAEGQRVYGRLTEAAGVWTLTYYTNEAGVETAHTLTTADISIIYWKVFNQSNRPTIPSNPLEFGTLDVTADVVDATAALRGLISAGTQSLGGAKTWTHAQTFQATIIGDTQTDNAPTGAGAAVAAPTKYIKSLTNGSLISISTLTGAAAAQVFLLTNKTGVDITINHDTGAAGFFLSSGSNFTFKNGGSVLCYYDSVSDRTRIIGGGAAADAVEKFTFTYAQLAAAALTNTIEALELEAKEYIDWVIVKHTTAFSGGTISAYAVKIGLTGNLDYYQSDFDVFQAVGDTTFAKTAHTVDVQSFSGSTSVKITATSVGDNLDQAAAGSVDIYVKIGVLP